MRRLTLLQKVVCMNKAAFFDRDGTINVEVNYLYKCEDFEFIEGMPAFIKKFNDWGFKVIVATNQAGIARGYYKEDDMLILHEYINKQLKKYDAHVDAFYFCPHHPDISGPCHCRKPETGMLEQAIADFDIDVNASILFGDKPWDIEAGERLGIKSYLINEGL